MFTSILILWTGTERLADLPKVNSHIIKSSGTLTPEPNILVSISSLNSSIYLLNT